MLVKVQRRCSDSNYDEETSDHCGDDTEMTRALGMACVLRRIQKPISWDATPPRHVPVAAK